MAALSETTKRKPGRPRICEDWGPPFNVHFEKKTYREIKRRSKMAGKKMAPYVRDLVEAFIFGKADLSTATNKLDRKSKFLKAKTRH